MLKNLSAYLQTHPMLTLVAFVLGLVGSLTGLVTLLFPSHYNYLQLHLQDKSTFEHVLSPEVEKAFLYSWINLKNSGEPFIFDILMEEPRTADFEDETGKKHNEEIKNGTLIWAGRFVTFTIDTGCNEIWEGFEGDCKRANLVVSTPCPASECAVGPRTVPNKDPLAKLFKFYNINQELSFKLEAPSPFYLASNKFNMRLRGFGVMEDLGGGPQVQRDRLLPLLYDPEKYLRTIRKHQPD